MPNKIASTDKDYSIGDLSVFPDQIDSTRELYEVRNNAESNLKQSVSYDTKYIILENGSNFPSHGIIKIGETNHPGELVHYQLRQGNVLKELTRGFAGSRQNPWQSGTPVKNSVSAETHNAVRDAIYNIQNKSGTSYKPADGSVNKLLKDAEIKYLAPKAQFRAFPKKGSPPLTVRFQSTSSGDIARYLWDFGDGSQSIDKNPFHVYRTEGIFTVKLSVVTSTGANGITKKIDYIDVSDDEKFKFFYLIQQDQTKPAYSEKTASEKILSGEDVNAEPAIFDFVDQTDGDITQRIWIFGDGEIETVDDPSIHYTSHVYKNPGNYEPNLLLVFSSDNTKRIFLQDNILVE